MTFIKNNSPRLQHTTFVSVSCRHVPPRHRILRDQVESVVVDRNHDLRTDKFDRAQCVVRAHCEVIADGDQRQIDPLVPDQFHIAKETRILRQIDFLAIIRRQQKAAGIAAARAIGQFRAVQGKRQFEIAKGIFEPAADMLSMRLDAFVAKPDGNFIDADHQSLCALGNGDRSPT